jgi:pyruvate/2-oxoacid:ferredoxin oxidoreductase alpha subunit/Pyruvate/2-oxoacid:ferredoxin oxidoreductase gamma subunit
VSHAVAAARERAELRSRIAAFGPFAIGVASLAGDRGIAINRIFANFFTAKGAWAGMAWQFGSSKRGTPVLSATFVDSRPLQRKDALHSLPVAVLGVTNFEEMKRQPDLFFGQLRPGGFLIINQTQPGEALWRDLMEQVPDDIRRLVVPLREERAACTGPFADSNTGLLQDSADSPDSIVTLDGLKKRLAASVWGRPPDELSPEQMRQLVKLVAMVTARVISVDMDGIMQEVTGSANVVSNLVAVGPMFQALVALGFPFEWETDLKLLSQGFPDAVLRNARLLQQYYRAMERARERCGPAIDESCRVLLEKSAPEAQEINRLGSSAVEATGEDPGDSLMIMGGTIAGMVLSQVAIPEHPLFYIGFPITPAGNPFYAMADAYANGHPHIVVDEVNPSEKVAAEKLIGVARAGGFLPVTFTASQGWRLFTEIIPQFVGARLEGLFLITKRALAAPNLNIEESHTDFMSFRDDGGIMLAPKSIQEYVATLYLARLLTHFAKLPVIVGIGGITDTHKIGLVKVPPDERVRNWLRKTLEGFDFLEHKLINRQGDIIVHGPSGTSAVYQETQSELEKAHQAAVRIYPYAVQAVEELTGLRIAEIEAACQSIATSPRGISALPGDTLQTGVCPAGDTTGQFPVFETVMILEGSLVPNAVEALRELEESGWNGMACLSVRLFNPFPEEQLAPWLDRARRIVVLDRSNSFGSVPPLASRVMGTLARAAARDGARNPRSLRTLVGGLGGREILVREMKELLLSTHLLFSPLEEWEGSLIARWLTDDPILKTLLEEAAALDLRSTNRHTRVPEHLRSRDAEKREYAQRLESLSRCLLARDYSTLLSHYSRVEFIAPREVLGETSLLQQIVIHVELRLAREALKQPQAAWRHAAVLLVYSQDPADRDLARRSLEKRKDAVPLAPRLLEQWGVPVQVHEALGGAGPVDPESGCGESAPASFSASFADSPPVEEMTFDQEEVGRIESILKDLVRLQGEKPLYYNPEDYERELLNRLQREPASRLHGLADRLPPEEAERTLWSYQCCYRDAIDRALQWEVLAQHHLPELKTLFTGANRERLKNLIGELKQVMAGLPPEQMSTAVAEELERYLLSRCLVDAPKNPLVYLELFRCWVAPELLRECGLSP